MHRLHVYFSFIIHHFLVMKDLFFIHRLLVYDSSALHLLFICCSSAVHLLSIFLCMYPCLLFIFKIWRCIHEATLKFIHFRLGFSLALPSSDTALTSPEASSGSSAAHAAHAAHPATPRSVAVSSHADKVKVILMTR